MMRTIYTGALAALVLVLAPAVLSGQGPPSPDRRAELEQQVRQQFLRQVAQRARLTEAQRGQVREVLDEGAVARLELAYESRDLRRDLMQAVRDPDTPMDAYEDILARLEDIRERERALERQEEARLSEVLDARQRALFLMMRMQLNDRIRRMQGRAPTPRGSGPPGEGPRLP
jgi:Spy/CpxP family protein refolding chaperone